MNSEYGTVEWCLIVGTAILFIAYSDSVFPNVLDGLPRFVAAGIKGGTGAFLGFVMAEIYGWMRRRW